MPIPSRAAAFAASFAFSTVAFGRADAAIICVSPVAVGCEATIQDAVDIASGVDTIEIGKGRYDENVVVPSGLDGLTIVARGAVLDADLPNTSAGLTIASSDVTISGLIVENGQTDGIVVAPDTVANVAFFGITVRSSAGVCLRMEGDGLTVDRSVFEGCGDSGIEMIGDGLVVTGSKFTKLGSSGIDHVGAMATVEKNKFSMLDSEGVRLEGDGARVVTNSFNGLDGAAIQVDGSDFFISKNKGKTIDRSIVRAPCETCTGGVISHNSNGVSTSDSGIFATSAGGLVIEFNEITRAENGGIVIEGDGITLRDNSVTASGSDRACFEIEGSDHTIERNTASQCANGGFLIDGDGSTLTDNTASETLEDGFDLEAGDGTTLSGNTAFDNLGVGFAVSLGVTGAILHGNRGFGNREDYCDAGSGTTATSNDFTEIFDPMGGDCPVDK